MRHLTSLILSLLCACEGEWRPDVPPPPARTSPSVAVEKVFEPGASAPAFSWSSTADHTAWVKDGQVHWVSATGRGTLPLPEELVRSVDAADGEGWALTTSRALFQLTADGPRAVPSPPHPLDGTSRVHAFGPGVLITLTPFEARENDQPAQVCVWRNQAWTCVAVSTRSGIMVPDGREPGTDAFVFHTLEGTEQMNIRLDVKTGTTERLSGRSTANALGQGDPLERAGQPPLTITTTATEVRIDCFKPRGFAVMCGREAHVADVVFWERAGETLNEVAHARLDAPLSPLRRHGPFLVSFTHAQGFLISIP